MSKKQHEKLFDKILIDSVDEALESLGENIKTSIYYHLEKAFMFQRSNIPYDIEGFSNALERIFGIGAQYVEILIMKKLYEKTSENNRWEDPKGLVQDLTFPKYVELMRHCFEDNMDTVEVEVLVNEEKQY